MTRWLVVAVALAWSAPALANDVAKQTLIFYNARMALREKRPQEALKLWLLHNTVANNLGERGAHDADFRSAVWAALGELGLCPDGFAEDAHGAGVWPLATHNWILRNMSNSEPGKQRAPFDTFDVGRQQRFVSLNDVLSDDELRTVTFYRTACWLPSGLLFTAGESTFADLSDRAVAARLLRFLLRAAKETLAKDKVVSTAVLDARIFDINLALSEIAAREARRNAFQKGQEAKTLGVTEDGVRELRASQEAFTFEPNSEEAEILRRSLTWSPNDWLTLNAERRAFLFAQAKKLSGQSHDELLLGIIDALIAKKRGEEVGQWLALVQPTQERRAEIYKGARGQRLLDLDQSTQFKERGAIALHRGVAFLEEGNVQEALRSFALALQQAETSRISQTVAGLARRWLSFVLSRYQTSEELLATLAAMVPRQEYNGIVEGLAWRAALRADKVSFAMCAKNDKSQSALDRRTEKLRPLAEGNLGAFASSVRAALSEEPHATTRFLRTFLDNLEVEDGDVRQAHTKTLQQLIELLSAVARDAKGGQARSAEELLKRMGALLDGLAPLDNNPRGLSPSRETFAGNIRLAPTDPLPWPFIAAEPQAPSAFLPLRLVPVEWRDPKGDLVFAWALSE